MITPAKLVSRVIKGQKQTSNPEKVGGSINSEAYERAEKSKTNRHIALAAIALTGFGGAGYAVMTAVDKVAGGVESAVPHGDMRTEISNTLTKVKISNKILLVEGTGRSTAEINVRSESNAPLIGGLYNGTVAKLTDRQARASREGTVQLGVGRDAIALEARKLEKSRNGSQWGLRAEVDASKVFSQVADMRYRSEGGQLQSSADNDFLSFGSDKGTVRRSGVATELADNNFRTSCGQSLTPTLSRGVEDYVRHQVGVSTVLENVPGQQKNTELLRQLARGPVEVVFSGPQGRSVEPSKIRIPASGPNERSLAGMLDTSPEDIHIDSGAKECQSTGTAFQDQLEILGLPDNREGL